MCGFVWFGNSWLWLWSKVVVVELRYHYARDDDDNDNDNDNEEYTTWNSHKQTLALNDANV